ncbi:MAG: 3-hydroxyacyl-CoA dehydrogenase/enoyl-CoA hydratase family protein [Actinomycetota bacterium]|nr:3-hydroxyacyl-CoA dehydrogenase/enoyl-CoA hydratase family protein [Actinomycetota bacterium]
MEVLVTHQIKRVAVLGAGTMGAAIAAHAANAGLEVDLLDIAPEELTEDEEKKGLTLDSPEVRNRIVKSGFERMKQARPPALMSERVTERMRLGNFEDDLGRVAEADWILEAIIEKLEPKQQLMARVEELAKSDAIIASNTSGIPLHSIAKDRSDEFKKRFLGTHFFNPPRYLKLLEIIPTEDTDPELVEEVRAFGERVLGKGVVIAKDTPNFIGNRLGSFSMINAMRYAFENGYGIEEVDAITGPLIGHPKTATFRLQDQVGLDISIAVTENLYELVPEDESREDLRVPETLKEMQERNLLGAKTGGGFYKREKRDGETVFDVLNLETFEHEPPQNPDVPLVEEAQEQGDLGSRLRFIMSRADEDRHAQFLRDTILPDLAYASRRVPEISDTLEDVDHAMEWGYGHEAGPFRMWDLLGVRDTVEQMKSLGIEVAPWVKEMLEGGNESFYKKEGTRELQFSPVKGEYEPVREDPMELSLEKVREEGGEISRNDSASLLDLGDGVLCFEIHSRGNSVDDAVVEMGYEALRRLEEEDERIGLVIGNEGKNFCVGANIGEIGERAKQGAFDEIGEGVEGLQNLLMDFRFASKPVVAAPHGQTLGAGAEICMHADRICAAGETYMGLVETGVGLIPAGGGTKEMVRRLVSPAMYTRAPSLPYVQEVFEQIAQAKVSGSALEAREMGFLREEDRVVMNGDHLLDAAKREALELADGYAPPVRDKSIYASGTITRAALEVGVIKPMVWGHYASEHDGVIGRHLARVLTGGDLSEPQWVPEEHILKLEQEAFLELLKNEKTLERIDAMLETGKPLRN